MNGVHLRRVPVAADSAEDTIARLLLAAFRAGGKLLICGNGGSAADAAHIAAELVGRFKVNRAALPAIALTDPAVLTAIGNDFGFEKVFARQVEALGRKGDVLLALSTSGQSPNVIAAIAAARIGGLTVIGFTGSADMAALCDAAFVSPARSTAWIQEDCMAFAHRVCGLIEEALLA